MSATAHVHCNGEAKQKFVGFSLCSRSPAPFKTSEEANGASTIKTLLWVALLIAQRRGYLVNAAFSCSRVVVEISSSARLLRSRQQSHCIFFRPPALWRPTAAINA
ncbi:hypothetical protein KCP73_26220 [Salmonella enterica subsp. enterica]|nr:hypothetical protein KCP73_26220 [Salmonella enterica subsp. enterica]